MMLSGTQSLLRPQSHKSRKESSNPLGRVKGRRAEGADVRYECCSKDLQSRMIARKNFYQ